MPIIRPDGRRIVAGLSALAFALICAWPYYRWTASPSLFFDDFPRVGSLRRTTLGESLFRPFNEHMAPLFETVSWLAWAGSGRRIEAISAGFMAASYLAFASTVGLLAVVIGRETRSRMATSFAVAAFGLSAVSAETVLLYSACSFQWAAAAMLAAWLAASLAAGSGSSLGKFGWLVGSAVAATAAPAFSAIGIVAGPVASIRLFVGGRGSIVPRLARSAVPIAGTLAYLLICEKFRYRELVATSVRQNASPGSALWATLCAPTTVLVPSLVGLPSLAFRLPSWLLTGLGVVGWSAGAAWAWWKRGRPLVVGGMALILLGYLATYATRARPGDLFIFEIQRYHLFPQVGMAWLLADLVATRARRLDASPARGWLAAAALAALLAIPQYPRMAEAAVPYKFPELPKAIAAVSRLERTCEREGITVGQLIATLEPAEPPWFPRPWPCHPLLNLMPIGPASARHPDAEVRRILVESMGPDDLEAFFGGMEATRYLRPPAGQAGGGGPVLRPVGRFRMEPIGEGRYRAGGRGSALEYEVGPGSEGARFLALPGLVATRTVDVRWAGDDGRWSAGRFARWVSPADPAKADWVVPLEMMPHWRPGEVRRLRVEFDEWGPVAVGTPRLSR